MGEIIECMPSNRLLFTFYDTQTFAFYFLSICCLFRFEVGSFQGKNQNETFRYTLDDLTMKHKTGFTLLELVIVIVILGILAVTAGPRFLNYQRDSHETVSHASFSAFTAAVNMYHSQWLVEGEPNFDQTVNYGVGDIYPSMTGYPIAVDQLPISSGASLRGGDCVALWNALMDTDLTIRAHGADVFPSEHDIVAWYTAAPSCYYYYTSGYSLGEPIPRLDYFPLTGELVTSHRRPSS